MELDQQGDLISQEGYYPFGATAWMAARHAVEVRYKFIRYSGKEMDVSGLYYYGERYYAPWLQRWLSADPNGAVDGLNLYAMVGNNPLLYVDRTGGKKPYSNCLATLSECWTRLRQRRIRYIIWPLNSTGLFRKTPTSTSCVPV